MHEQLSYHKRCHRIASSTGCIRENQCDSGGPGSSHSLSRLLHGRLFIRETEHAHPRAPQRVHRRLDRCRSCFRHPVVHQNTRTRRRDAHGAPGPHRSSIRRCSPSAGLIESGAKQVQAFQCTLCGTATSCHVAGLPSLVCMKRVVVDINMMKTIRARTPFSRNSGSCCNRHEQLKNVEVVGQRTR